MPVILGGVDGLQTSVFGRETPAFDSAFRRLRHIPLSEGAWVEYVPGWLTGHEQVFEQLIHNVRWNRYRRQMYERMVDVPRLTASLPDDGPELAVLQQIRERLSARYGWTLERISLAYYRDGNDSVAWHGDRMGRLKPHTIVASVSVGVPRRLLLRPARGGRSFVLSLGWGDLFVMGGSCQQTWQHCVPKTRHSGPRISIMFRPHVPDADLPDDEHVEALAPPTR